MGFFERYKKRIIIAAALILTVCAIATAGRTGRAGFIENALGFIITPVQQIFTTAASWVDDRFGGIREKKDLAAENEELKERIAELEMENRRLELMGTENKKLSDLVSISQKYAEHETTGVNVISKDPGNWYETFILDKGSGKGFSANMVLVNSSGLVGKVVETAHGFSKAMSILDSRSSISAMSSRTGDIGVVKGDRILASQGLCRMEYIDAAAEIMEGDEIVTSHLAGIYPPGISIGVVREVANDANGLTKYAVIQPLVDFKHLDTMLAIDYTKPYDDMDNGEQSQNDTDGGLEAGNEA